MNGWPPAPIFAILEFLGPAILMYVDLWVEYEECAVLLLARITERWGLI